MQSTRCFHLVFISVSLIEYTAFSKSLRIEESLVLDLKILMYRNTYEIEKLKKIKADSDLEMVGAMKQLKELSESRNSMQQELVALREVRDAAQEVAEIMEILEGNEDEVLSLVGKLRKVPEAFERYVRKLPDRAGVGLQLYSARTFHVTLSPRIYKSGQGPPPNIINT